MDETTQSEIKMQNVKFKKKKRKQQTKEKKSKQTNALNTAKHADA